MPLVSWLGSKEKTASAEAIPGYCAAGKRAERSARALHAVGEPTATPSIRTDTRPPPGTSARRLRASTQPKLLYALPAIVSPGDGVSIAPNGCVAVLLVQVTVRVPSSVA